MMFFQLLIYPCRSSVSYTHLSNSAGFGLGVVQDETVLGVHALKLNDRWQIASHPLGDGTDAKHIESLSVCNLGHSPYIHFGKILYQHLNYPIGLIPTSRGGASLGAWNPAEDGDLYRNMLDITQNLTCILYTSIRQYLWLLIFFLGL